MRQQLGDLPQFAECGLCQLPRQAQLAQCPFCGSQNPSRYVENVPEDFAVRLVAEGRWETASEYLESEIASGRETASYALLVAWIALLNGDLRAVETWCHESLRLDSGGGGPHVLLGLVFERAARWEEAVAEYALALVREPAGPRQAMLLDHKIYCESQIPEW